jgi:hypothetical protein
MFTAATSHYCISEQHKRLVVGEEDVHDYPKSSQTKQTDENIKMSAKCGAQ